MAPPDKLNALHQAALPARDRLVKLGYSYEPREVLAVGRRNERELLVKPRLRGALLRLNSWMTDQHVDRMLFTLDSVWTGIARNQIIYEFLTYGMPLDVIEPGGRSALQGAE